MAVDVPSIKKALKMADAEWARNGLIATDQTNAKAGGGVFNLMRHLDSYRGLYPESFGSAVNAADEIVGNLVFSLINTMVSQLSARNPEPLVRPHGGTAASEDAWRRAFLNQKLVYAMIREKNFKREVDRALLSALISPFGFVRHGFTPTESGEYEDDKGRIISTYKNERPDMPWIRAMRPWEIRIDPMVNNFDMDGAPKWIAFRNLYTKEQIRASKELINRADWKPTFFEDLRPASERHKPTATGPSDMAKKAEASMYEEWVVYDSSTRMMFGVSEGSESLVREEQEWPLEWGQLPGSIITMNEQLDSPFGLPFPQMIWDQCIMFNKVMTTINVLINRTRRLLFINGDQFLGQEGELDNLINPDSMVEAIVGSGDPRTMMAEVGVGHLDGQIVGLLFQLKEQIREILGISEFDRGQRANVETAAEANNIAAGASVSKSRVQAIFEAFWVNIIQTSHRALLQADATQKFTIPILGEENHTFLTTDDVVKGFAEVKAAELAGEFDYGIKMNSTLPHDPAAEYAATEAFYKTTGGPQGQLSNHVYIQKRLAMLAGLDPSLAIVSQETAVQMGENDPTGSGPEPKPGGQPPVPNAGSVPGAGT